ncbi:hypothetical protein [Nocardia carnea]|uniref:alpha/beta hydrolase n=1 Tax=Nocardia carnea TaxID=37328 RepID=UPI002457BAF5|nr:hypothetical protein [Nocardia carnea]
MSRRARRWPRRVGVAALVVAVLAAGYLTTVGVLRYRTLVLPEPTGRHMVGRLITTVPVGSPTNPEQGRAVWIWYPANSTDTGRSARVEYAPPGWREGALPPTAGLGWMLQDIGHVQAWARTDAEPAAGRWPLVALSPGFATAPWMYTSVGEELASHGYIVALSVPTTTPSRVVAGKEYTTPSPPQPQTAAIDRLAGIQAADLVAMVNALVTGRVPALAGQVDHRTAIYGGHSLGGTAATLACDQDERCPGSINMDGPQPDPARREQHKPVLLIASEAGCAAGNPCDAAGMPADRAEWLALRHEQAPPSWEVAIAGAGHNAFGDPPFYFVAPPFGNLVGTGDIAPHRMHTVLTTVLTAALTDLRHNGTAPALPQLAAELPELQPLT